ncbi:MAG: dihydrodipicolinate synthase family protein [Phycisphaeraceae bacterium]
MNTAPVNAALLQKSVVAVPPLARNADLALNREENIKLIRHIEAGGVSTMLYGGNANFYNTAPSEFESLLAFLEEAAGPDTTIIPSVGPMYGTMMDQARVLRGSKFATAMVLPAVFGATPAGVETGVRHFVEAAGKPAVLYIKDLNYITPEGAARVVNDGLISVIKYAIVRADPAEDAFLSKLITLVDPKRIMSGIGEQPAIVHLRDFRLGGFTSGCICVGPKLSMDMLRAMQAGDWEEADRIRAIFTPLEDLRNAHSPIRVLHEAVRLAGISDTGPILPLLSNLDAEHHEPVALAAKALLEAQAATVR